MPSKEHGKIEVVCVPTKWHFRDDGVRIVEEMKVLYLYIGKEIDREIVQGRRAEHLGRQLDGEPPEWWNE